MMSYDQIAERLSGLEAPESGDSVRVEWLVPDHLAIGRDTAKRNLVMLPGPALEPSTPIVRSCIEHGPWHPIGEPDFTANVLRLPTGPEFAVAATTISVELLRHGLGTAPVTRAFAEVEPFIALVIRRILMGPKIILGLLGELVVLEGLLEYRPEALDAVDPTSCWDGHLNIARDFTIGAVAIEVKTTARPVRQHVIDSLDQIEARIDETGSPLEQLYLASLGLQPSAAPTSISVSQITDRILTLLGAMSKDPEHAREAFLQRLSEYGPDDFSGYRHEDMSGHPPYSASYDSTLEPKLYRMNDPNLRVIRRADLEGTVVRPEGITYRVLLPEQVPGSPRNPYVGLKKALQRALQ